MNVVGIGQVIAVLNDLRAKKIINEFAIGGAVAAVLHNEPISTIDLDIFSAILGLEKNKKRCNLFGCLEL